MDLFSSEVMTGLKKGLDAAALRHRVIANNIANVNTPYFKKSAVVFESMLKKAVDREPVKMAAADPRHFGGRQPLDELRPEVKTIRTTSMRTDGNNVDIDQEMAALAANTIYYRALATGLSDHYSILSLVITGGRR